MPGLSLKTRGGYLVTDKGQHYNEVVSGQVALAADHFIQ